MAASLPTVIAELHRLPGNTYVLRSILLVMVAVAAPLLVLLALSTAEARVEAERRAYALLKARADRGAQEVQAALDQANHLITFMAGRERLQALDPQACRSLVLGVTASDSIYTNVGLFDANGNAVCVAAARAVRVNFADTPWFKQGMAKGDLFLSTEQRGALSGKRVVYLTRPVQNALGQRVGLIALSLDVDALNRRLHFLGDKEFSLTIRQGQKILMRAPAVERWAGQAVPDQILNAPDLPSVPIKIAPGLEGKIRAFTVTPMPRYGLESVAGMPERAVYEEADGVALRGVLTAAIALALGFLTAWGAASRLATSIKSIGQTASRLRAGEMNVRADVELPSVFGEVAREFNRLTEANLARAAELERVADEAVRLRRFYQALSETGQAIVRQAHRTELYVVACQACTRCRLADGAWLVEQHAEGWAVEVRHPDRSQPPSDMELISLAQQAARTTSPLVVRLCSSGEGVAVPINVEPGRSAVLVLTSELPGWFDAEVALLLAELGRDLSFGFHLEQARMRQSALIAAEAANQAKSSFLSHVSHELRTPLNAVVGFSQLSMLRPAVQADDTLRSYLQHVLTAARHLKILIDDLLDVSRIDIGELTVEFVEVDVAELVRTAAELQKPAATEHNVTVRLDPETPAQLRTRTDPGRLRQVLTNLISNAIKYNRAGGEVRVGAHCEGGRLCIQVRDNGQGMSESQMGGLFTAFNRLGREKSAIEGTGIGLFLTKKVVELLGGQLKVESEEGVGTCVTVDLVHLPPASPETEQPDLVDPGGSVGSRLAAVNGTVLYIEDNPVNALLVENWFSVHTNASLIISPSGGEGIIVARQRRPDLVLLDMQLPDMHGLQVLRALKGAPETAGLRVVALSANAMQQDVDAAKKEGVVDYWSKPIDFQAMTEGVLRLLGDARWSPRGRVSL